MTSALTTPVFMPPFKLYFQNMPTATVISANPTATTLQVVCLGQECDATTVNNTVVVGPWADKTVAKGAASTGTFHWMVSVADFGVSSIECLVRSGTAETCTTAVSADGEGLTKTATGLAEITRAFELSFSSVPVVITEGQNLIKSVQATATELSSSARTVGSESAASDEPTVTGSSTYASSLRETNGANLSAVPVICVIIMAGLVSAIMQA